MCLRSNRSFSLLTLLTAIALFTSSLVSAQPAPPQTAPADWGPVSINLEEYEYPYPVEYMDFTVYGEDVRVAYMDVAPTGPANGRTVIFHHGGLYYSWYWEDQIRALSEEGFRVIAKDRLGWGKSSKPEIPYSMNLWASNTARLMDHLGYRTGCPGGSFDRRSDGHPLCLSLPGTGHSPGYRKPDRPDRSSRGPWVSTVNR